MVIPVYNESECVTNVISEVLSAFDRLKIHPAELILVDDGSTDTTSDILLNIKKKDDRIRIITHPINRGIGAANKTGFNAAYGEWIGWIPADGQINPDEVLNLYLKNQSADMIVTLTDPDERLRVDKLFRVFISKGLRFFMHTIIGLEDNMIGVFLFKRKVLSNDMPEMTTGLFNIVFPNIIQKKNYHIVYVKSSLRRRINGCSKVTNLNTTLRVFCELLAFRLKNSVRKIKGKTRL